MRNIRLVLEYDGSNYHGWQSQTGSGMPTVQSTLEEALRSFAREEIKIHASGRTDAGVHALGQVAHFQTTSVMPPHAWAPAVNRLLPGDIRVLASDEVPADFHARFSAVRKTYVYRILCRRSPTAIFRRYAWHVNMPLNAASMQRAAAFLIGRHDFSSFQGSGCAAKTSVRTMLSAQITKNGEFMEVLLEADAFLQYMVRNITGTLVEVGLGRFDEQDFKRIFESLDRTKAGRTAPPQGLYLVKVDYPDCFGNSVSLQK